MVLLDDVVKVAVGANLYVAPTNMLASKQPQRAAARNLAVECDLSRDAWGDRGKRLAKEGLRGCKGSMNSGRSAISEILKAPYSSMTLSGISKKSLK